MAATAIASDRQKTRAISEARRGLSAQRCGIGFKMSEAKNLFPLLQQSADPGIAGAIEKLVRDAPDRDLCRVNLLDFVAKRGLDEEKSIAAFLHAARLGLFELSWNVLCPSCAGVLDASTTLRGVNRGEYHCAWCAAGYEPILDEIVEVTFTVNRRVRRIAAHDPNDLPFAEYLRQVFWSSAIDLPENCSGDRGDNSRHGRASVRREGPAFAAITVQARGPARPGHPYDPIPRGQRRADPRAPEPVADFRQGTPGDGDDRVEPRATAPVPRKSHRHARIARVVGGDGRAQQVAQPAQALPQRKAAADQPGVP